LAKCDAAQRRTRCYFGYATADNHRASGPNENKISHGYR
jgi:hypothetical protein